MKNLLRTFNFTLLLLLGLIGTFRAQTVLIDPAGAGGFELGPTFTDNGWTAVNATTNTWQIGNAPAWFTGSRGAFVSNNSGTNWAYTNSTAQRSHFYRDVTFPAGETNINLSFDWRGNGSDGNWDNLLVYIADVSVTPATTGPTGTSTTATTWTGYTNGTTGYYLLQRSGTAVPTTTTNVTYTFTTAQANYCAGNTKRIIFTWKNDGGGGTNPPASVDNILLTSSCTGVSPLAASSITLTSATLNANVFAGATGYNFRYRPVGSPTWISAPANPYTAENAPLTGLTPNTNYEFQVAAVGPVCNVWSSSLTFVTGYCFPASTSQASWVSAFNTTGGISNITYSAAAGTAGGYNNQSANLSVSNYIGNNTNISMTAGGPTCGFAVWVDWNNNLTFETTERVFNTTGYVTTTNGTITIPAGTANGTYRMRVVTDWNSGNPTNPCANLARGEFVDYSFVVISAPTCFPVTGLTNTQLSLTSATHTWTAPVNGTPVNYEWIVTTSSTPPASGTSTTALTATSTGLLTDVNYFLHVRTNCGGGDFSSWSTSPFTLGYCIPNSGSGCTAGDLIASVSLNTLNNVSGTTCVAPYNNYTTNPTLTTSLQPSTTYNCIIGAGAYAQDYAVWIDYNDNGTFETTERVGFTTSAVPANSTAIFPISLACTPPAGIHRMRVRSAWNVGGVNITPCGTQSYGEVEDYLITIVAPPTCPSPGAIATIVPGSFTADITFPLGCSAATNFDLEYGPFGFTQGSGILVSNVTATINGTNATVSLTGLDPLSSYQVYIRANCGGGDISSWGAAGNFNTLEPPCTGTPNVPVASATGNTTVCPNVSVSLSATGFSTGVQNISNNWEWSIDNVQFNPIAGATNPTYSTGGLSAGVYYYRIASTCTASSQTSYSNVITITVNTPPTVTLNAPNNGSFCGTQLMTASGADSYTWSPSASLGATTGSSVYFTGTADATVTVIGSDAAGCQSTPVTLNVVYSTSPSVTATSSVANFCGTGGITTITATSTANYTYLFEGFGGASVVSTTGNQADVNIPNTSYVRITGTDANSGCSNQTFVSVGVYPLPTANVTTDVNGICPGTQANINSGLSAGNFTVSSIPYAPSIAPANAGVIMNNGTAVLPLSGGTMDDGGWANIPIGFAFNYFGNNFSNVAVGTNGLLMFGTVPGYGTAAGQLGQFTFNGPPVFPNANNPGNVIALMAADMHMGNSTTGSVRYWTEGFAPNRVFVLEYRNVRGYSSNPQATVQCKMYETIGVVEVHLLEKTFSNTATIGLQDATKTIGAVAPGRTGSWTTTTPEGWRFSPPSNYTTVWSAITAGGSAQIASGTNIFTQQVSPTENTTYDISYTNQTTGCSNPAGSAQVAISILGNVAPAGIDAVVSAPTVCSGVNFNLSTTYTGSNDGLTFQWQVSTNGGVDFTDVPSATGITLTTSQTVASIYRLQIISCNGAPGYTDTVLVGMSSYVDCYCIPASTFGCTDGDVIARVVLNTLDNNTGTACPSGTTGYNDYTNDPTLTTTLLPSSSYLCTVYSGDWSGNYAAWIDYNDNGIFEASERIGFTADPVPANSFVSFPVVIDCNPPAGPHRLRVREVFAVNGVDITPCNASSYGEVEDYLITISPAPTCPSLGLASIGGVTTTSAEVNWTMNCSSATAFDIEYGSVGFTPGTGTLLSNVSANINGNNATYLLSGLAPNGQYDIYVRANCGNGDVSPWSTSPVVANTPCIPVDVADITDLTVCDSYILPNITEVTASGNQGLTLSYNTNANGSGTVLAVGDTITSTQTVYILGTAGACSDVESVTVTVNYSSSSTTTHTECSSYTWNGTTYTTGGTYTFVTTNAAGCDSIATLVLTITQPTSATLNVNACQSYTLNNQTYTSSGVYTQTLTNVAGCDSTITLNLTVGAPDVVNLTETACNSFTWNGTTYTTSGNYVANLTNIYGCDSTVNLALTVNYSSSSNTALTACDSYTWNGNTYTASGTYTYNTTNVAGCDSTATLVLTIGNNGSITTVTTCGSFQWSNNQTYTQSGTYNQTLTNVNGCDSVLTLNLTILPLPTATVTDNGAGVLTSTSGATYQWIDCATNAPIAGATSQVYSPTVNGSYAVIVTNSNNCSKTSECVVVDYIGLDELTFSLNVYPNPTNGDLSIAVDGIEGDYNLVIQDMNGRTVAIYNDMIHGSGVYTMNMSNVVTGVYFVKMTNGTSERVVRVVKQ